MTPGKFVRLILGPAFRPVGEAYRSFFVDVPKVVRAFSQAIPDGACVLDVGGGDGYIANVLLNARPDLSLTMTDLATEIGGFISRENRSRVTLLCGADLGTVDGQYDVITLADVLHHVPVMQRPGFLTMLSQTAHRVGCKTIIIKDVEPGSWRARLALLADVYISGDKNTSFTPACAIALAGFTATERFEPDPPNYCVIFHRDS